MAFWIVAGAMAAGVAALMGLAMLRARRDTGPAPANSDIRVYRDQLTEVERDLARGILTGDEAAQVRIEVSRRLLEADRKAASQAAPGDAGRGAGVAAVAVAAVVVAGAVGLYHMLGAPGYPDLPLADRLAMADEARASRPTQDAAEAEMAARASPTPPADPRHLELVEQLRTAMIERPDDLTGHSLLARNEAALGNFAAARVAQARVIELRGPEASAIDYANLADLLVLAAGGFVTTEAEAALAEALRRDPGNGTALYYSGLLYAQTGRPDRAFALWRPLLEQSDPGDPWYLAVRAQIDEVAALAGVRYSAPPPLLSGDAPLRGPSAEDLEAARDMAPEDRAAMIENMVDGLSARLAEQGGTAEEWAQLITALGVLGRVDQARAIADEAMTAFAAEPASLPLIEAARQRAGIAE